VFGSADWVDVPLLSRGAHHNPHRGACLMELVSVLAESRWTDRPSCVEPTLAQVARATNDLMSDDGRPLLIPVAPALVGTAARASVGSGPGVAVLCLRAGLPHTSGPIERRMLAALDTATEALAAGNDLRPRWFTRNVQRRVLQAVAESVGAVAGAHQPGGDRDRALRTLLLDCLNEGRRRAGEPPVDDRLLGGRSPDRIRVRKRWVAEDGGTGRALVCELASEDDRRRLLDWSFVGSIRNVN